MEASRKNPHVIFALKLTVGVVLLSLIVIHADIRNIVVQLESAVIGYILLAFLFQIIAKGIWAKRWQIVLRLNGMKRSFFALLGLVHIGLFFNNFMPSSVGGDVVRGYYASDSMKGLAKSIGAVLIERIVGVVSLALMAALAVSYAAILGEWQSSELLLILGGAGSIVLLGLGLSLLFWRGWHALLDRLAKLVPKFERVVGDLSASLKAFSRADRNSRVLIAVSSVALQVVAVCFYVACARSLGIMTHAVMFFVIIPISVVVSMLPISLNGLGVREATLISMFVAQGESFEPVAAFALLALAISTSFGIAGGILYIFWRPTTSGPK